MVASSSAGSEPAGPPSAAWSTWTEEDFAGLVDMLDAWKRQAPGSEQAGRSPLLPALESAIASRDMEPFFIVVERATKESAARGVSLEEMLRQLVQASGGVAEIVAKAYAADPPRLGRALRAFIKLKDGLAVRAGEVFAHHRVAIAEEAQRKVIRELSTPVIEIWQGILVMPLIGLVDSSRARQMMEQLLERIKALGSRVVILDVTGVPAVDTEVANHFLRTMQAARLVGAATILVGISPGMAQTLVRLDITLPGLETYADLRSGLEAAFRRLGYRVVRAEGGTAGAGAGGTGAGAAGAPVNVG